MFSHIYSIIVLPVCSIRSEIGQLKENCSSDQKWSIILQTIYVQCASFFVSVPCLSWHQHLIQFFSILCLLCKISTLMNVYICIV